ncbi:hypothetical protein [Pseudomonas sp.]|uniref:hypothetical protein n=1 Tax=Pseudomonas sp. TaxID=306 RepID=UPI0029092BFB|nr:hypothetical protein [Pseudomonas sp.]MDU4254414.1 hypothetical protein [Pseudomonas sp.]
MRIIDRSLQTLRLLSVAEVELLRLFIAGKSDAQPELLARVRADHRWLACDCVTPAPVMHVALLDGGRFVLKNNPDAAEHAPGCPFVRTEYDGKNSGGSISHIVPRLQPDSHVALHSEFKGNSMGIAPQISRRNGVGNPRPKALLSLLLSILESAGMDSYSPHRPLTIGEQYAAIRNAAGRFVLKPGIPLDHVLDTRINFQRLVAMSKKLRDTEAFGTLRRYGLLLDVLNKVGPRQLVLDDGSKLNFFGSTEVLHSRSVPLLTLATVASQETGSNYYHLGKVAFVPVLSSRHLFPVVDDKDRENVQEIFALLRWFHEKKQIQVTASRCFFQGGDGYMMALKSGAQLLELDLHPHQLDGLESNSNELSLSAFGSIEGLKKRIVAQLLKGVSRV